MARLLIQRRIWIACPLLLTGCMIFGLGRELDRLTELAVLQGRASPTVDHQSALVVVLQSASAQAVDFTVLPRPGPYFFAVPAGRYRLAAFEDRNGDLVHQRESEPAVVYDAGAELALAAGDRREGFDIALDTEHVRPIDLEIGDLSKRSGSVAELPSFQMGSLASLDDDRFSPENAQMGLWQPARFVFEVGAGVFFLEEYDPERTPVLFVHGALGSPRDFAYLIDHLDHSRFQAWVVYYPTANDLEGTARYINRVMLELHARYRFKKIAVISHSMGGLVARAAINLLSEYAPLRPIVTLPVFVTISTPWQGQPMAQYAGQAPTAAPSWLSIAPGSAFLTSLPKTSLPYDVHHYLFFGYRGSSAMIGEANDDVVAVSSQLPVKLQRRATRVLGFAENHTSILASEQVAAAVNAALAEIEP